jgi:hypothetical protein
MGRGGESTEKWRFIRSRASQRVKRKHRASEDGPVLSGGEKRYGKPPFGRIDLKRKLTFRKNLAQKVVRGRFSLPGSFIDHCLIP